jgi:hypothetical protein
MVLTPLALWRSWQTSPHSLWDDERRRQKSELAERDDEIRRRDLELADKRQQVAALQELVIVVEERSTQLRERDLALQSQQLEIATLQGRLKMACDTSIASLRQSKQMAENKDLEILKLRESLAAFQTESKWEDGRKRDELVALEARLMDAAHSVNLLQVLLCSCLSFCGNRRHVQ